MMRYIIIIFIAFVSKNGFSQDPNFSQFYNVPVYYNPAMNAMDNGLTITSHNRMLWSLIPNQLNTYLISAEIESIGPFNVGGLVMSNTEGQANLKTNAGYFNFSFTPPNLEQKRYKFQFGTSIGVLNKTINSDNFVFSDQLDEVYGKVHTSSFENNTNSFYALDLKFGAVVRNFFILKSDTKRYKYLITYGVAFKPMWGRQAFVDPNLRNQRKWTFHTDHKFMNDSKTKVYTASFIYEIQQPFQTFTFGFRYRLPISQEANSHKMIFGTYYRNRFNSKIKDSDAIIFTLGSDIFYGQNQRKIKIYYSYDLTISQLNNNSSGGSHELGLQMNFDDLIFLKAKASRNFKQRMHKCPSDL